MIAIKNNKNLTSFPGNYCRVTCTDTNEFLGFLVKHTASTSRQNHQGQNSWDIFEFYPASRMRVTPQEVITSSKQEEPNAILLGRTGGQNYYMKFLAYKTTLMGSTYVHLPLTVEFKIADEEWLTHMHRSYGRHHLNWGGELQNPFKEDWCYTPLQSYYKAEKAPTVLSSADYGEEESSSITVVED